MEFKSRRLFRYSLCVCAFIVISMMCITCIVDASFFSSSSSSSSTSSSSDNKKGSSTSALESLRTNSNDYYEILDLADKRESATVAEVKLKFRSLSRKYHPDVASSSADKEVYAKINRAYEVLSDKRKRKMYDMRGEDGLKLLERAQAVGNNAAVHPLAQFFGMSTDDGLHGPKMSASMQTSLENVFTGGKVQFSLTKQKVCPHCKGSGAQHNSPIDKCKHCHGQGVIRQRNMIGPNMFQEFQTSCPACGGAGEIPRQVCPVCHGKKVIRDVSWLEIDIEPGMPEGHQVTFEMEGDESPDRIPGDLVVTISTLPHARFTRRANGLDLETTLNITLKETLLGFDKYITHLDGKEQVRVTSSEITEYGKVIKIARKGLPKLHFPSERGDLYVKVMYHMPASLTIEQRNALLNMWDNSNQNGSFNKNNHTYDYDDEDDEDEEDYNSDL